MTKKEKWLYWSNRIGIFFVLGFLFDTLWHYFRPVHPELIDQFYGICYFWWTGFNFKSIVLALMQTYIWSYLVVGLWYLTDECCKCKK